MDIVPIQGFEWVNLRGVVEFHSLHRPGTEDEVPAFTSHEGRVLQRMGPTLVDGPVLVGQPSPWPRLARGTMAQYVLLDPPEVLNVVSPPSVAIHGGWNEDDNLGYILGGATYSEYEALVAGLRQRRGQTVVRIRWSTMGRRDKTNIMFAGPDLASIVGDLTVRGVMQS